MGWHHVHSLDQINERHVAIELAQESWRPSNPRRHRMPCIKTFQKHCLPHKKIKQCNGMESADCQPLPSHTGNCKWVKRLAKCIMGGKKMNGYLEDWDHELIGLVGCPAKLLEAEVAEVLQVWPCKGDHITIAVHLCLQRIQPARLTLICLIALSLISYCYLPQARVFRHQRSTGGECKLLFLP